jgi:hypothetical protein
VAAEYALFSLALTFAFEDGFDVEDGFVGIDKADFFDFFDEEPANEGLVRSDSAEEEPPTATIPGTPRRATFEAFSDESLTSFF